MLLTNIKSRLFQSIIAFIVGLSSPLLVGQNTKGVVTENTSAASSSAAKGNVFAMVAGISNYPFVKPLNFAEEDALLFLEFLRSDAGGNVPENHIKLLLNEQATHANVTSGLAWLDKNTGLSPEAGDRVYIYLSGHGDAYDASEAYYLCYDSNPAGDKNNYQLGGALDIGKMKKRLGMMVNKGVEVILIVDACRSGDVPGVKAGIGNPYQSVIEAPVGEILLLAAGPNQFALEDRRWGGGHGSFTWYLVKGLSGEADSDGDGIVQLFEIQNYTQMKVIGDTRLMGAPQTPYICCNGKFDFPLARKDETFAKRIKAEESGNTKVGLTAMAARDAMENALFENDQLKTTYFDIKKKCQQQKYLGSGSAWELWEQCLKAYPKKDLEPIRMYLMGALAAEGQKAINQEMNVNLENSPSYDYYKNRRKWVEHAILLQQEKNEITGIEGVHSFLKALELCNSVTYALPRLDSVVYTYENQMFVDKRIIPYEKADSIFNSLEKDFGKSAVFYYLRQQQLSNRELYYLEDNSSLRRKYILKAIELAPHWAKPLLTAVEMKLFSREELDEKIIEQLKLDSSNADLFYLAFIHYNNYLPIQRGKAVECLQKAFELRPSTSFKERLISVKFPHATPDFNQLLSIDYTSVHEPTESDWKQIQKILNYYYSHDLHRIECQFDSTNLVRKQLTQIIGLAVYLKHTEEALKILAIEDNICPSYESIMCEAIIQKYVYKNKEKANSLDLKVIKIPTNQTVILDFYGINKDNLAKELQDRALYQSFKLIYLLLFRNDEWIKEEKNCMDSLSSIDKEAIKLNFSFQFLFNAHLDKDRSSFDRWNEQLNYLRNNDAPDYIQLAFTSGYLYGVLDSINVFKSDEKLNRYLGILPSLDASIDIMEGAKSSDLNTANKTLLEVFKKLEGNKEMLISVLSNDTRNRLYTLTTAFDSIFGTPQTDMDRWMLFRLYKDLTVWDKAEEVFNSFDFKNRETMNSTTLILLVYDCLQLANYSLAETCLNQLIPFVYNSHEQDNSKSMRLINTLFFYDSKLIKEGIYQSPEFKRLYDKYVVN